MALLSSSDVPSDVVHQMDASICLEGYKLVNPSAAALDDVEILGQPVKASGANMVFVLDTDEANAIGVVVSKKKIDLAIAGVTDDKYAVLVRGPASLNQGGLPANDVEGDAFTIATLVTAYKALGDIAVKIAPSKEVTQTD